MPDIEHYVHAIIIHWKLPGVYYISSLWLRKIAYKFLRFAQPSAADEGQHKYLEEHYNGKISTIKSTQHCHWTDC